MKPILNLRRVDHNAREPLTRDVSKALQEDPAVAEK
jgi:hypothetical protein